MTIKTILVGDTAQIRAHLIPTVQEIAGIDVTAVAETQDDSHRAAQQHDGCQLKVIDMFLREGAGLDVLRGLMRRRPDQVALVMTNYPKS